MRKFTLIILLFLGSVCNATDNYYVSTNGNDSYTDVQCKNDPNYKWKTLAKALNTASSTNYIVNLTAETFTAASFYTFTSSHNGKTIVIQGNNSDANQTVLSSQDSTCFIFTTVGTANITWKDLTIKSVYSGNRGGLIYTAQTTDGMQLTFDNCILGIPNDPCTGYTKCIQFSANSAASPSRKIILINSYCYGKDQTNPICISDINTLIISNTLVDGLNAANADTGYAAILLGSIVGSVTVNNGSIINSRSKGIQANFNTVTSFSSLEVNNVTFDCNNSIVYVNEYLQHGTFENITANDGIYLGYHYKDNSHPLGTIIVRDNKFVRSSPKNFGLVLGFGVNNAEVSNNTILDFDITFLLKGKYNNIHHNIFRGGSGIADAHVIYVRAAKYNTFKYNSVYTTSPHPGYIQCALKLYDQTGFYVAEGNDTDYNVFTNNIFDASGRGGYAIFLSGNVGHNLFDYNCYVAGSIALGYAGGANKTLSQLRTWWADNGGSEESKTNDSHSIDTAPQFANLANNDFHLKSQAGRWDPNSQNWVTDAVSSPCIDAGDPNSDWTLELWPHGKRINIGAYGETPEASMSLSNLGNIADLDDDDRVDYNDMELFVEKWLYQQVLLPEDLDRNGAVNFIDFAGFAKLWFKNPGLRVTINPQEAIDAGAQWRRLGTSTWLDSDYTENDVAAGSHMVEFKDVPGWAMPTMLVSVNKNQLNEADAVYMPAITIGTDTNTSSLPLATSYHDARAQTVYLAGEIGGSYTLTALALYVTTVPGQTMNNFTIRMKHTDLSAYGSSPTWESSDWTTVYQTNEAITTIGWVKFDFTAPFEYNGTQNLMIDISFNNNSSTTDGKCRYSWPGGGYRSIYYKTNSGYGDPLNWSGRTPTPIAGPPIWNTALFIEHESMDL